MSFDAPPPPPDPASAPSDPPPAPRVSVPLPPGVPPPPGYVPPPVSATSGAGDPHGRPLNAMPARVLVAVGAAAVALQFWHQSHGRFSRISNVYAVLVILVLAAGAVLAVLGRRFGSGLVAGTVAALAGFNEAMWWRTTAQRAMDLDLLDVLGFAGTVLAAAGVAIELRGTRRSWNWPWASVAIAVASLLAVAPYWAFDARKLVTAPAIVALIVAVCGLGSAVGRGLAVGAVAPTLLTVVALGGDRGVPMAMQGFFPVDWSSWQVIVLLLCGAFAVASFLAAAGEPDVG